MNKLVLTPDILSLPITDLKHVKMEIDKERHLQEMYAVTYKRRKLHSTTA